MSAAQKTRSATGMRAPAKGKVASAAAQKMAPIPRMREINKASRSATTASAIWDLLARLDALAKEPITHAAALRSDTFWDRWNSAEARLLRKLAKAPDLEAGDLHRMIRIALNDPMLRNTTYEHPKRLRAILARVHDELVDRARQPAAQPVCTLEQAAVMDFEGDGGAAFDAIGTAREWHSAVGCHWSALSSAGIVMRMSSAKFREGACKSPGGIEAMHGMWENVQQSLAYFEALAKLLRQAEMRLLVTLSHSALHEPAAVEAAEVPA